MAAVGGAAAICVQRSRQARQSRQVRSGVIDASSGRRSGRRMRCCQLSAADAVLSAVGGGWGAVGVGQCLQSSLSRLGDILYSHCLGLE